PPPRRAHAPPPPVHARSGRVAPGARRGSARDLPPAPGDVDRRGAHEGHRPGRSHRTDGGHRRRRARRAPAPLGGAHDDPGCRRPVPGARDRARPVPGCRAHRWWWLVSLTPVPIDKIHPDRHNIREDLADVEALAESIKAVGLLQPLVVRPRVGGGFTIIDGHRRYQAALIAGVPALPCLMSKTGRSGGGTEVVVMLAAAMHQALTPIEAARAFGKLERRGMTPGEIARATGYSTRTVRDRLALLH